ncbi:MAG: DUF4365 domain-containing protein [Bdellovibrionales bacterium]|nr:DUF4365 domain-containing protein [Bdellovibrionales bacterium]
MYYPKKSHIGAKGEAHLKSTIFNDIGWIYRPQPESDIGIDGEIEILDEKNHSKAVLAKVQVKTSEEIKNLDNIKVPVDEPHLVYWSRFRIPVLLVAVDLKTKTSYWTLIDSTISVPPGQETFSVHIPKENIINVHRKEFLSETLAIPRGVFDGLIELVEFEAENLLDVSCYADDKEFDDANSKVWKMVQNIFQLAENFEGVLSFQHRKRILMGAKKVFENHMKDLSERLNNLSHDTVVGNVRVNTTMKLNYGGNNFDGVDYYDFNDPSILNSEDWIIEVTGSVCMGHNNSGKAIWRDIADFTERGWWSSKDPLDAIGKAKNELVEVINDFPRE